MEIDGFYTWHFQKAQYLTEGGKKNIPIYQINKKNKIRAEQQKMKSRWGQRTGQMGLFSQNKTLVYGTFSFW